MRRYDHQGYTRLKFGTAHAPKGALTSDDITEVCKDLKHRHAYTQAAVTGTITTDRHGEMEVVCENWGLNHPTFRTSEGQRLFLSGGDDADDLRLLFKKAYGDAYASGRGYKYPVESVELDIHWHRTPDCPVCGEGLTYGMMDWMPSDPEGGHMDGWLCNNCLPNGVNVSEGIR